MCTKFKWTDECQQSFEKLKNLLRVAFGTTSWVKAVAADARGVVVWLDEEFGLLETLEAQRHRTYTFGDVLAARGTVRSAPALGDVEDVQRTLGDVGGISGGSGSATDTSAGGGYNTENPDTRPQGDDWPEGDE